jgi:hypothetical protein
MAGMSEVKPRYVFIDWYDDGGRVVPERFKDDPGITALVEKSAYDKLAAENERLTKLLDISVDRLSELESESEGES